MWIRPRTGRPRTRCRRGAAAVELAVILPLMVLLALGCIDFGRFAYNYIAVTNAARAGGSHGIMNNYTASTLSAWRNDVIQAVREEMNQQTRYDPSLLNVTVEALTPTDGRRAVRVTARYPFRTIVPWPGIPSNVMLTQRVQMRLIR